ncbi:MAG: hypothetical protein JNL18_05200 [Planctomycetaceae bacterium]|nr:hypothetical protein [Planctomycetaceae bacterium]
MSYPVSCECGETSQVVASEAGATFTCPCGRTVRVPALSKLRAAVGNADDFGSVLERVRQRIKLGKLPCNEICPITGGPATATAWFEILCEREWSRRRGVSSGQAFILALFGGWLGFLLAITGQDERRETLGSDVSLLAPLRLSPSGADQVGSMRSQRALKRAFSMTPIYRQLLQSYPAAKVLRVTVDC